MDALLHAEVDGSASNLLAKIGAYLASDGVMSVRLLLTQGGLHLSRAVTQASRDKLTILERSILGRSDQSAC